MKQMQTKTCLINRQLWKWVQPSTSSTCIVHGNSPSFGVVDGASGLASSLLCCSMTCRKKSFNSCLIQQFFLISMYTKTTLLV